MALSYHKRDTFQSFNKLKMLEYDLALAYEKCENKTSQASQKHAKAKVSFLTCFHSHEFVNELVV